MKYNRTGEHMYGEDITVIMQEMLTALLTGAINYYGAENSSQLQPFGRQRASTFVRQN